MTARTILDYYSQYQKLVENPSCTCNLCVLQKSACATKIAELHAKMEHEGIPRLTAEINKTLSKFFDEILDAVCKYDITCLPSLADNELRAADNANGMVEHFDDVFP